MRRRLSSILVGLFLLGLLAPAAVLAAAPKITRFSPTSGSIGTQRDHHGYASHGCDVGQGQRQGRDHLEQGRLQDHGQGAGWGQHRQDQGDDLGRHGDQYQGLHGHPRHPRHPDIGPGGASVKVSGSGFTARGKVDPKFDTTKLKQITVDAKGTFTNVVLVIPTTALAGTHSISALDRKTSKSARRADTVQAQVDVSRDWPQFRHGPTHTGYNPAETAISSSNVGGLAVVWTGTTGASITSSPAVANGVVYVGSNDGKLRAYSLGGH